MGGGASKEKAAKQKSSVQDEAKSFVSKIGALKLLIKRDRSRETFIQFLKDSNDYTSMLFIEYYHDIEELHKQNINLQASKLKGIIEKYKEKVKDNKLSKGAREILGSLGTLSSNIGNIESLNIQEILNIASKSQTEIAGSLIPEFEKFVHSDAYHKWQKEEHTFEKGRGKMSRENSRLSGPRHPPYSDKYPSILIVDESSVTAKIAFYSLQNDGHKCEISRDGLEAFELMKANSYDIAIVNMNLPGLNGNEMAAKYRALEKDLLSSTSSAKVRTKPMIIIGMSVSDDSYTKSLAAESGMNGFFHKPFSLYLFLEAMNQITSKERVETDLSVAVFDKVSV